MGYVCCNCYREGLTGEPPFPREQIVIGKTGRPTLAGYGERPFDELTVDQMDAVEVMFGWTMSACGHPGMLLAQEELIDLSSLGWLRSARYPGVLDRYVNLLWAISGSASYTSHTLPVDEGRVVLAELDDFVKEPVMGTTRTIQEPGGSEVFDFLDVWGPERAEEFVSLDRFQGVSSEGIGKGVVELGVVGHDFVVRTRGMKPRELFRARSVSQSLGRQQLLSFWPHEMEPVKVTFRDEESGHEVTVRSFGVRSPEPSGVLGRRVVNRFFMGRCPVMTDEVMPELETYRRLLVASIFTGNPLVWF